MKGQTTLEFVIVLALSMIILVTLVDFTTTKISQFGREDGVALARQSLSDLRLAIDGSYAQGTGTIRQATITWPEGMDTTISPFSGNTLRVRAYETDIVEPVIPSVSGTLPLSPGSHRVKITVSDSSVSIGTILLSSNLPSVYLPLVRDSNRTVRITLTNLSSESASVSISNSWSPTVVTTSISPSSGTIYPNEMFSFDFLANANASALGNYGGEITITGTFSSGNETLTLPSNVEVFPSGGS